MQIRHAYQASHATRSLRTGCGGCVRGAGIIERHNIIIYGRCTNIIFGGSGSLDPCTEVCVRDAYTGLDPCTEVGVRRQLRQLELIQDSSSKSHNKRQVSSIKSVNVEMSTLEQVCEKYPNLLYDGAHVALNGSIVHRWIPRLGNRVDDQSNPKQFFSTGCLCVDMEPSEDLVKVREHCETEHEGGWEYEHRSQVPVRGSCNGAE